MQEFSSVTASSYDAESLAPMLTEKAAEGWSVVSIISAGTNVVAYLTRGGAVETPEDSTPADSTVVTDTGITDTGITDTGVTDTAGLDAAADQWSPDTGASDAAPALADAAMSGDQPAEAASAPEPTPADIAPGMQPVVEPSPDAGQVADAGDATVGLAGGVTPAAEPVIETPVVESVPEPVISTPEQMPGDVTTEHAGVIGSVGAGVTDQASGMADQASDMADQAQDAASDQASDMAGQASDMADQAQDAVSDQATDAVDQATDAVEQVQDDAAGAAEEATATDGGDSGSSDGSGVPAGWYADPSGRYELRYWDGSAWTEHVSRAGQQYTDPPVA